MTTISMCSTYSKASSTSPPHARRLIHKPNLHKTPLNLLPSSTTTPMALHHLLLLLSLLAPPSRSQQTSTPFTQSDFDAAIADMRAESFYGFAMLLKMLNVTKQPNWDLTFFVPGDRELSQASIPIARLDEFLLGHSIPMPLFFNDLVHFPTGSIVPSGRRDKVLKIHNRGRMNFFVNNARITTPNVCSNSIIKCHGIDSVIDYDNPSYGRKPEASPGGRKVDKRPALAPPGKSPPPKPSGVYAGRY